MIKCVVPISGGKDSQLCAKLALKKFKKEEVMFVFCDTGYEHPLTYKHIEWIEKEYGVQTVHLKNNKSVYDLIIQTGCFPTDLMRFCTNELKIQRSKNFYAMLVQVQGFGFEVWYGMRLGESYARSQRYKDHNPNKLYEPHEMLGNYPKYLGKAGIRFKLPILTLEEEEVFDLLGDEVNPLYSHGFDRVGCFPCLAGRDGSKETAFSLDEFGRKRRIDVIEIGQVIQKNIFTTKGGRKRNPDSVIGNPDSNQNDMQGGLFLDDVAPCHICNI